MNALNYKIGKQIRNKQTKEILEIQNINGKKLWVNLDWGDTFDWVDEDLYDDLDYIK